MFGDPALTNRIKRAIGSAYNQLKRRRFTRLNGFCLNIGPGPHWKKPSGKWVSLDIDSRIGDIVLNLCEFSRLPFRDSTVECIYASHVFEHVSIHKTQLLFNECFRVLKAGGYMRIVVPDVVKSMEEYFKRNADFRLFARRRERAKRIYGEDYTMFECLKEDFISRSSQPLLLRKYALAHQNAFDFETLVKHLRVAGFKEHMIWKCRFRETRRPDFSFEGEFKSEANETYRSLYCECQKP